MLFCSILSRLGDAIVGGKSANCFAGCLSKVQIFTSVLTDADFNQIKDTTKDFVPSSGLLHDWAGYRLSGASTRVFPSQRGRPTCPAGQQGSPCQPVPPSLDRTPPTIRKACPASFVVELGQARSAEVKWEEPQFDGANNVVTNYENNLQRGVGIYDVTYVAFDEATPTPNIAKCSFTVYVRRELLMLVSNISVGLLQHSLAYVKVKSLFNPIVALDFSTRFIAMYYIYCMLFIALKVP